MRIKIPICCFPAFLDGLLILLLRLFLFFDNPFDFDVLKRSRKFVDAGVRVYRKVILKLKEFVSGVEVVLSHADTSDGVHNVDVIVKQFERNKDELLVKFVLKLFVRNNHFILWCSLSEGSKTKLRSYIGINYRI